ncbi:hypothetical protein EDC56_1239 [Sinobacterium caligoides]|uniref:Uncharacterized protein n=1 Tax=Sinobacterium caligoides TaxID=933926 RepID=A0A3N2E0Q7_9GAMM|nr:hypothetical protein [Sinobacterium caligoides]ROS05690.1 hypothetical protein EDC56_1239 [Sinobacterium caligoides]
MNSFGRYIFFVFMSLCASCSEHSGVEKERNIFLNFKSYQSSGKFEIENPKFKKVANEINEARLQQYRRDDYQLSGDAMGLMLITFFDDRLMQVIFYPSDCSHYQELFSALRPHDTGVDMIYDIDYKGACYASWSDQKLQAEYDYFVQ